MIQKKQPKKKVEKDRRRHQQKESKKRKTKRRINGFLIYTRQLYTNGFEMNRYKQMGMHSVVFPCNESWFFLSKQE